jgi:hypothetical protein
MDIQTYFQGAYAEEKELFHSIELQIKSVLPFYKIFTDEKGWPYKVPPSPQSEGFPFSSSTTAMIAYSFLMLMGNSCNDIAFANECASYIDCTNHEGIRDAFGKAVMLLMEEWKNDRKFKSNTFGYNNPFSLVWIVCLLNQDPSAIFRDIDNKKIEEINGMAFEFVRKTFETIYTDMEKLKYSEDQNSELDKNHIFPLLKTVQLYCQLTKCSKCNAIIDEHIKTVSNHLRDRLHYHLSADSIQNSDFDVAEMVFSLEGMLLLDNCRDNFDQKLIDRIFAVISERQKANIYWRPLKPIVVKDQGLALLPLSVEIAISMLRICRLLEKRGKKLFSENYWLFKNYTEWLKSRVIKVDYKGEKFLGWCSEHVLHPDIIHTWETSQVLVYLANFNAMLKKHIANATLAYANLSCKPVEQEDWDKEPLKDPAPFLKTFERIEKEYLKNESKCFSMLLYGPPGTGKTSIAMKIAKDKGWPLITITPSDFIVSGADQVETKAKNIFRVLEEQSNAVVLFDEIDQLIMDRESEAFQERGDIFQLMTPSMLVKFNDLRNKEQIIFIISTNYEERIDPAIKRIGRIDNKFLIIPPDKSERVRLINGLACFTTDKEIVDFLAEKTVLYSHKELERQLGALSKNIGNGFEPGLESVKKCFAENLIPPTISLSVYKTRCGKDKYPQQPRQELFYLTYLKAEVNSLTPHDIKTFKAAYDVNGEERLNIAQLAEDKSILENILKGKQDLKQEEKKSIENFLETAQCIIDKNSEPH